LMKFPSTLTSTITYFPCLMLLARLIGMHHFCDVVNFDIYVFGFWDGR
jgi:hypothetical protein